MTQTQVDLHHGDCLEVMPTLAPDSVAMVFADLPYGLLEINWDVHINLQNLFLAIAPLLRTEWVQVYTATHPFAADIICANRATFRYDIVWQKARCTNFMQARYRPMRSHESLLVFNSSRKSTYNAQKVQGKPFKEIKRGPSSVHQLRNKPNTMRAANPSGLINPTTCLKVVESDTYSTTQRRKLHPTQKPIALLEWLIRTYTNAGDTVIDPVMGSGTTGVACKRLGRHFIGIEKDETYFKAAKARIEAEPWPTESVV